MQDLETWLRKRPQATAFAIAPALILTLFIAALVIGPARDVAWMLLDEGNAVEIATFVFLVLAACLGFELARRALQSGDGLLVVAFYTLFALGLILTAGEEVAWGQQWLGFETPAELKAINKQGETTLHNVEGLHGHTEIMRLSFGIGGLIGVWLGSLAIFRKVGANPLLIPWFAVIALHAAADLWNDYFSLEIGWRLDRAVMRTAEVIELLIAVSAFLYFAFNLKMFGASNKEALE